jgi:hypothetical protein
MLRAISADVAHAADPRRLVHRPLAADPSELRDPEYIACTLPALRVMADVWSRADVRGLENIPPRGPVLVPGIRAMLTPCETVPASPENMRRALACGAALLVYPGGDHETYRASWRSVEIDFAHRTGFVRLALKHGVRIVPVVSMSFGPRSRPRSCDGRCFRPRRVLLRSSARHTGSGG